MIYPWQYDHMGHMNVMWYNTLMAAVQQDTSYKRELRAGDIITIRSGIIEIREKVIRFFHEMRNDETGEIAANTALTGVHMDAKTRRACPFPLDFLNRVQQTISDSETVYPDELHDRLPQGSFPTDPSISGGLVGMESF